MRELLDRVGECDVPWWVTRWPVCWVNLTMLICNLLFVPSDFLNDRFLSVGLDLLFVAVFIWALASHEHDDGDDDDREPEEVPDMVRIEPRPSPA